MPGTRKKMRNEVVEKENNNPDDCLGSLPNELLSRVLSYFSFKEISRLRQVNRKFKDAGNGLLKIGYRHAKSEVALCNEKARYNLRNSYVSSTYPFELKHYTGQIFWFAVSEFLSNSFCLFDMRKGYLNKKYIVNAKTLDVVRKLLWFKEMDDALPMVIEMVIGRSRYHSNMKCFEDEGVAYYQWLSEKKYNGRPIKSIRVPVFNKRQPGLDLPRFFAEDKKECYALVLDLMTTLWKEEINTKQHRLISKRSRDFLGPNDMNMIPALKPGQNPDPQMYVDSDMEDYGNEIFQPPMDKWEGHTSNQRLDDMISGFIFN